MSDHNSTPLVRLKTLSIVLLSTALVVGCGSSSDSKKSSSSSSSSLSSQAPSSQASSSEASSSEASSSEASSSEASSSESSTTSSSETSSSESSATSSNDSSSSAASESSSSSSAGVDAEPEPNDVLPFPSAGANAFLRHFGTASHVDDFTASANPGINPQLSHSQGKLKITPQWTSESDKLSLEAGFPIKNLAGGSVSFNLYLTEGYIDDGNLYVQIYLKDSGGRYANTKAGISANGKTKREWISHSELISTAELDFVTSGFDINSVNTIGIEIVAQGKPVSVGGDIYIDNLLVNFGADIPVELSAGHNIIYPSAGYSFASFERNWGHDNLVLTPSASGLTITGWSPTPTANSTSGSHTVLHTHNAANISFTNAYLEMIVTLTEEQVNAGITLQIFAQNASWDGSYSGFSLPLRSGDNLLSFQLSAAHSELDRFGLTIGMDSYTGTMGTPVIIKAIGITLDPSEQPAPPPPAASSVDFETDAPGTTYTGLGWSADNLNASVVNIASVTGLPAHGTSTRALKVSVTNYNAMPKVTIAVPSGKTLADYDVHVDIYFPVNSAGVSGDGDNGWKSVWLFAGTSLSGGAQETHADYQSSLPNGSFHDQWHTFEFAVDPAKAALLSGNIEIAVGINRSASNHTNDAYYIDSIRLIER